MTEENGIISISHLSNNESYLWRYMNLHKLIDFISSSELHFSRLDTFPDAIEGVAMSTLKRRAYFEGDNKDHYNLTENNDISYEDIKKLHDAVDPIETETSQKKQFVNCWFKGERESIAMWDLYSNSDSIALKVCPKSLIKEIEKNASQLIKENGNRINIIGDSVKYLKLNPFESSSIKKSNSYSGFNKDLAFKHENEYRFLIVALEEWTKDEDIQSFRMKIDVKNIDASLVCHPLMDKWKKSNIQKLLDSYGITINVEDSNVKLRKV